MKARVPFPECGLIQAQHHPALLSGLQLNLGEPGEPLHWARRWDNPRCGRDVHLGNLGACAVTGISQRERDIDFERALGRSIRTHLYPKSLIRELGIRLAMTERERRLNVHRIVIAISHERALAIEDLVVHIGIRRAERGLSRINGPGLRKLATGVHVAHQHVDGSAASLASG